MIDEGERAALNLIIEYEYLPVECKNVKLKYLLQNCHESNQKYFFLINYKYAKLVFKQAVRMDASTLENANLALTKLQES